MADQVKKVFPFMSTTLTASTIVLRPWPTYATFMKQLLNIIFVGKFCHYLFINKNIWKRILTSFFKYRNLEPRFSSILLRAFIDVSTVVVHSLPMVFVPSPSLSKQCLISVRSFSWKLFFFNNLDLWYPFHFFFFLKPSCALPDVGVPCGYIEQFKGLVPRS